MAFGNMFANTDFELVAPDGSVRGRGKAQFDGNTVMIHDSNLQIFTGDEIRRTLPSGVDEAFEVIDPVFYGSIAALAHFEVKVKRKGTFPHNTGGNYNIAVTGDNARVNIGSTDQSTNTVTNSGVFGRMIETVESAVNNDGDKEAIISAIKDMELHKGTSGFAKAYQHFIGITADHIGVLSPFLPALATFFN